MKNNLRGKSGEGYVPEGFDEPAHIPGDLGVCQRSAHSQERPAKALSINLWLTLILMQEVKAKAQL